MGFDKSFLPFNLVLIGVAGFIWSQLVTLWVVVPIAFVLALLALDPLMGQYLCVAILAMLIGIGMGRSSDQDAKPESNTPSVNSSANPSGGQDGQVK